MLLPLVKDSIDFYSNIKCFTIILFLPLEKYFLIFAIFSKCPPHKGLVY